MSISVSSTELLDMDHGASGRKDGEKLSGLFVSHRCLAFMVLAVVVALLAVGLMAGYLGEKRGVDTVKRSPLAATAQQMDIQKPEKNVRLPKSVKPMHYALELKPDLEDTFTFVGSVAVTILCITETDNVKLHTNKLDVFNVSVHKEGSGEVVPFGAVQKVDDLEFLVVPLGRKLEKGASYVLRMGFNGTLADDLAGFYRSSYKTTDNKIRWLAATQFEPTDARRAFPCFDEPDMKATFAVTIIRPSSYTSLSNMPIDRTEIRPDGLVSDIYQPTLKMSTYLLAFVVSDFISRGTNKFKVWARPDAINSTEYALSIGPRILDFYEEYFHTKYPLNKTDMIALPDFEAGAMENWGLITYRETALLFDNVASSALNKLRVAIVVAHELAHQWFGNLVTMQWWDDLWLNEGFATYVEYLGVEKVEPDWGMKEMFVINELQNVMELDALRSSHPVSVPVSDPREINQNFDRISYGKGAAIIRMMNYFLTENVFQKGLQNYLSDMKFSNAKQDDLWQYLTNAQESSAKINVKEVMDLWTLQTGFPVVVVNRSYRDRSATLTQKRFLIDGDDDNSTSVWKIPVTYTGCSATNWTDTETKVWLNHSSGFIAQLPESSKWFMVNVQQVGYYKVNYDDRNWELIIDQLKENHTKIHVINRAQVMDDIFDLARAGMVNYSLALTATEYLRSETNYTPWYAAFNSFGFIDLMLRMTDVYGIWMKYVLSLLQRNYDSLTWTEGPQESILKTFLRSKTLKWACEYGHRACISTARHYFERWRSNGEFIPPNFRYFVYCTSIQHGDYDDWEFLWKAYLSTSIASERITLLTALGCPSQPWIMQSFLKKIITPDSGVRRQDIRYVFGSVALSAQGRILAFNFILQYWEEIYKTFSTSSSALASMVRVVSGAINTEYELRQLECFQADQKDRLGGIERTVQQSLEKARTNVQWMKLNYNKIQNWLKANVK